MVGTIATRPVLSRVASARAARLFTTVGVDVESSVIGSAFYGAGEYVQQRLGLLRT